MNALHDREVRVLAIAASAEHVHLLARFPMERVRRLVGDAKRACSHALRDAIPGAMWAKKCGLRQINDEAHQSAAFAYIVRHADEGAWVWTFRDGA